MPVRNLHWYNANEGRAYPVDDVATCDDDNGRRLPSDIIADLNLRWPSTLGKYAFVTAVSVTPLLVTVTIQASDDPDAVSRFSPLAVVTVRKPVSVGRMITLQSQAPGVGGWIVFGHGIEGEPYQGRFSSPAQSRLTLRAARSYRPLPVRGVQAINAAGVLTGVVTLKVTEPLAIAKEERYIGGANRDCIVVRLIDTDGTDGFTVPTDATQISGYKAKSVFQQFAGPCFGRPESNTCGCPQPVEFVNAVAPDCNGVVTLEFAGCAQVAQIDDVCGIAVTCQFGLVDACLPAQLPSSEGLLPSEYTPANIPVPPDIPPEPPPAGTSDSLVPIGDLPYVACFVGGIGELDTVAGTWEFSDDNSPTVVCAPVGREEGVSESLSASASVSLSSSFVVTPDGSYQSGTAATRCVALFDVDTTTVFRKAATEVKLTQGPQGAKHVAHLVINYRPHSSILGQHVYFAAELNYDTQEFRLVKFNGTTFQTVAPASVVAPGIQLDKWYKLEAVVLPAAVPGDVNVSVRLTSVSDPGAIDISLSADTSTYQPSNGKFGVGTNRAISRFAYLTIAEAT